MTGFGLSCQIVVVVAVLAICWQAISVVAKNYEDAAKSPYRRPAAGKTMQKPRTMPSTNESQIAKDIDNVLKIVSRQTVDQSSYLACVVCFFDQLDQNQAQACVKKDTPGRIQMVRTSCSAKKQLTFKRAVVALLQAMERGQMPIVAKHSNSADTSSAAK